MAVCIPVNINARLLDDFERPGRWTCHEPGSQWETDVVGTEPTTGFVTEGDRAMRVVFDPARGHGKGQISLPFDLLPLDLSGDSHLLLDVSTDQPLILRADLHDANYEYMAGRHVILQPGEHRDLELSLRAFNRERLRGVRRLSLSFTGHDPETVLIFDNLRAVAGEGHDEDSSTQRPRHQAMDALFRAPGNVAMGAMIRVSSVEGASTPASAVNDRSHDTRWASSYTDDQWLEIHFPHAHRVNQVALHWESAFAADYRVLAMDTDGEWIEVADIDDGRGGTEIVTFEPTETAALRLEFGRRATVYGFSIYEIAVRDDPSAQPGLARIGGGRQVVSPVINFRPADHRGAAHDGPPVIDAINLASPAVAQMQMVEAHIDLRATWENPYDPEDISLIAEFESPSGDVRRVPGFYYWPFERNEIAGQEQLVGGEAPQWVVRFTPTEAGVWTMRAHLTDQHGSATDEARFAVLDSEHPGFVRVSARNPHYFAFDDGSTYFPIGLNMCWYADHGDGNLQTLAYDRWLEDLAASGGNYIRVWMFSISFNPEWADTGLGQYDERQPALWRLDHIVRRCEELGIQVQLCLINHGQLSLNVNSEWESNPYNAANGGPLSHPSEFFTHPAARELFRRRLRYLMARYSHSPNIMAWEWFNEIEWTNGLIGENLGPWIEEMTAVVREHDPNNHLFTISSVIDDRLYTPPTIDFVQPHSYEVGNWPPTVFWMMQNLRERYGKPVFLGEIGMSHMPPAMDLTGRNLHTTNWASLTGGAAGGAMTWWWDGYVAPRNLWVRYRGISAFTRGEQLDNGSGATTRHGFHTPDGIALEVSSLHLEDRTLAWIRRTDATTVAFIALDPDPAGAFSPITNAVLPREAIGEQHRFAEFWDTESGEILARVTITNEPVAIPPFETDIAVKLLAGNPDSSK